MATTNNDHSDVTSAALPHIDLTVEWSSATGQWRLTGADVVQAYDGWRNWLAGDPGHVLAEPSDPDVDGVRWWGLVGSRSVQARTEPPISVAAEHPLDKVTNVAVHLCGGIWLTEWRSSAVPILVFEGPAQITRVHLGRRLRTSADATTSPPVTGWTKYSG